MFKKRTKLDEINRRMLREFRRRRIEDTVENRISFLTGMHQAWEEDRSPLTIEKMKWMDVVTTEILHLRIWNKPSDR